MNRLSDNGIHSDFANRIALYSKILSRTEKEIAQYMLQNEESISDYSIHMLAQNIGVGVASIVRFSKTLGYSGFSDMKFQIEQGRLIIDKRDVGVVQTDDANVVKQKVLNYAQTYLERCIININNATLTKVSDAIASAKKVGILGAGSADGIAQAIASMFMSMGVMAISASDPMVKIRLASYLEKGDVLIGLSFSGYSKSVGDALYFAKRNEATTVLLTAYRNSLLSKYADYELYTPARTRGNALNIFTSAMCQLALLQIIQALVSQKEVEHIKDHEKRLKSSGNMQRYDIHQGSIQHGRIHTVPGKD